MNYLGVWVYLDDLVVWSDTWQDHIARLHNLFRTLTEANLTLNQAKRESGHIHVTFLRHVVVQGKLASATTKVEVILHYPATANKEIMQFMDMVGYYR